MAQLLGKLDRVLLDSAGNVKSGVSVEVRKQGATVEQDQSGTAPFTINVDDVGKIVVNDVVSVNEGTATYTVGAVNATAKTIQLVGFAGALFLTNLDRLTPITAKPSLFKDIAGDDGDTNPKATDANGTIETWLSGGLYDLHISGGGVTTKLVRDVHVPLVTASLSISSVADLMGVAKWSWDTQFDNDQQSGTSNTAADQSIHTEWLDKGARLMVLGGLDTNVKLRLGDRAITSGVVGEKYTLYASESITQDLTAVQEHFTIYGISIFSGNVALSADTTAVAGELHYTPTTAKAHSATLAGTSGRGRMMSTHAGASANMIFGGSFNANTGDGSAGAVTHLRSLNVVAPLKGAGSTVAVTNALSFYCPGPAAGVGSAQNYVALFDSPADLASHFYINRAQVRIQDADNQGNSPVAGRWVDIYRDWDGADPGTPLYVGLHLTMNLEGTFTAGDDAVGVRAVVRTDTAASTNFDDLFGFEAFIDHRNTANIGDMFGYKATLQHSASTGTVDKLVGFTNVIGTLVASTATKKVYGLELEAPDPAVIAYSNFQSTGHIRFKPIVTLTPKGTLDSVTAEENGVMCYVEDTNHPANSGMYFRINGEWYALTADSLNFHVGDDS